MDIYQLLKKIGDTSMSKNMNLRYIQKQLEQHCVQILGQEESAIHAVLVPLISIADEWHVAFEVRSEKLRRQPGEICFPGGRVDASDTNAQRAAVRETCEELGIEEEGIEMMGALDYLVTPFQVTIYPFVGKLSMDVSAIHPNPDEVGEVFYVPLDFLFQATPECYYLDLYAEPQRDFPFHLIPRRESYNWRTGKIPEYFYFYKEYVIWGMTARILHHFLDIAKQGK